MPAVIFIEFLAEETNAENIHLIGYSAGTRVVMEPEERGLTRSKARPIWSFPGDYNERLRTVLQKKQYILGLSY